jgi:hypothetical protein
MHSRRTPSGCSTRPEIQRRARIANHSSDWLCGTRRMRRACVGGRDREGPRPTDQAVADQAVADPIGGKILTSCCWKALPCWDILRNGYGGREGAVHAVIAAENHRRRAHQSPESQRGNPRLGALRRPPTVLKPTGPGPTRSDMPRGSEKYSTGPTRQVCCISPRRHRHLLPSADDSAPIGSRFGTKGERKISATENMTFAP